MAASSNTTPSGVPESAYLHTPALWAFEAMLSAAQAVSAMHSCVLASANNLSADSMECLIKHLLAQTDRLLEASLKAGSAPRMYASEAGLIGLGQVCFTALHTEDTAAEAEFDAGYEAMLHRFTLMPEDPASASVQRALLKARPILTTLICALALPLPDLPDSPPVGPSQLH